MILSFFTGQQYNCIIGSVICKFHHKSVVVRISRCSTTRSSIVSPNHRRTVRNGFETELNSIIPTTQSIEYRDGEYSMSLA